MGSKVGRSNAGEFHETAELSCPWLKRIGVYGFMFFLIKGLLWLLVPAVLVWLGA